MFNPVKHYIRTNNRWRNETRTCCITEYIKLSTAFLFTFIGPASLTYLSITNKMQRYTMVFITINALYVSVGSSVHHQELKTVYTTSGICPAFTDSYRKR